MNKEVEFKTHPVYRISIENPETKKVAYVYVNGIGEMLEGEWFNRVIRDLKGEETWTIKGAILKQLGEE